MTDHTRAMIRELATVAGVIAAGLLAGWLAWRAMGLADPMTMRAYEARLRLNQWPVEQGK